MPLSTKEASQRNVVPFTVVFWVVTQIFAQRKRGRFMTSQTYKKKKFSFVEQENMLKFACLIGRIHACVSLVLAVRLRTWAKQTLTAWPLCLFRFNHWSQEEKNRHRAHLRSYVSEKNLPQTVILYWYYQYSMIVCLKCELGIAIARHQNFSSCFSGGT